MFVVVITVAAFDVIGERLGHRACAILPGSIPSNDIGDVIAHHASEPATLLPGIGQMFLGPISHIRRGSNANRDIVRITADSLRGFTNRFDSPRRDIGVGQLQNETVGHLARHRQHLRPIRRKPNLQLTFRGPGEANCRAFVINAATVTKLTNDVNRFPDFFEPNRRAVGNAHGRITTANPAHRSVAIHLVERGKHRCSNRPVTRRRIGHHRPHDDFPRLGQNLAIDHIGLLPKDVGIKRPHMTKPIRLSPLGQIHHPRRRRIRLQHHTNIHQVPILRFRKLNLLTFAFDFCF